MVDTTSNQVRETHTCASNYLKEIVQISKSPVRGKTTTVSLGLTPVVGSRVTDHGAVTDIVNPFVRTRQVTRLHKVESRNVHVR